MYDRKQAQLLEQYLAMLRQDASAAPPPDLDPVIAELAQKLKQQQGKANAGVRARVWERTLAQHRFHRTSHSTDGNIPEILPVRARYTPLPRSYNTSLTLAAAVTAVIIFFAIMLVFAAEGRRQEEYAARLTQVADNPTATPTSPVTIAEVEGTSTPLPMDNVLTVPIIPAGVGQTMEGMLAEQQPMVIYRYEIQEAGVFVARVEAEDFEPMLHYSPDLEAIEATAGQFTIFMQQDMMPTLVPTAYPPLPGIAFGSGIEYISTQPNPIWFAASAGEVIRLHVSSLMPGDTGTFSLATDVIQPIRLEAGEVMSFIFTDEQPFAYFVFEGNAGEPFLLTLEGSEIRNLVLFDTAQPRASMNILPSTAFALNKLPLSRKQDGITGIILEPEQLNETITVSLTREI